MQRLLFMIFIFSIFIYPVFAEIRINEIMYDPECSDSYCEYVELYNNGTNSVNITNWKIGDDNDDDPLEGNSKDIIIPGKNYALIVDSDSRVYSNFDVGVATWLYVAEGDAIGNGLSNSETITLFDENNNTIDSITYSGSTNGKSYSYVNGSWDVTEATPGKDNAANISYVNDYSVISISEFLPDPDGEDDQAMEKGEWIELYNSGNEDLDLLGFSFYDNVGTDADIVITNTTTKDGTLIKSKNYLAVYMNGVSGFLNNNGYDKIKLYDLNSNLIDEVSYEGSDEGVSWSLADGKWERSAPSLGSGNMDNSSSVQSEIRIDEIYDLGDGKAEWGDIIRVEFFVYKGNTEKYTVWIWVEDSEGNRATKKSKFSVYDKFQNYTFTYPIGIPDNCDSNFADGNGKIIVEGLDAKDEEILEIREKPLCKNGVKSPVVRVKDFEYELVEFPEEIIDNEEFNAKIMLKDNKEDVSVDVSGYVFSGKKKYSNEDVKTVELKQGEEKIVDLKLNIEKASEAASPRLKIKILKEGRKTPYDITKEIKVEEKKSESVKKGFQDVTGNVVYEGKSTEAGRMGVFFFSGLMTMLGLYGFFRGWRIWK